MEIIFGPVPSRRLGLSLGIDLVPLKTCTQDCIHCELGRTATAVAERREYVPFARLEQEIRAFFETHPEPGLDYVTLSGSGEPTLNRALPRVVELLRELTPTPIALLTNSTLFADPGVRAEVSGIDLILPSLDAVSEDIFQVLNRPAPGFTAAGLIAGLVALRREFPGAIWLEILFCRGLNDHPAEVERLVRAAARIAPERIQLNTVARPGALESAVAVENEFLAAIRPRFRPAAEIIAPFRAGPRAGGGLEETRKAMLATLRRRPCTAADLEKALSLKGVEVIKMLDLLREKGEITARPHQGELYYSAGAARVGDSGEDLS